MNQSFAALNAQTHRQTALFLAANEDPRFYAERNREREACCPPHRDPHYFVALDGSVQKETPHYSTPPAGHFKKWDETDSLYFAPEPLQQPTRKVISKPHVHLFIEYATAMSKISDSIAQKMARPIEYFTELTKKETMNAVECEVVANFMDSEFRVNNLSEDASSAVEKISEAFAKKLKEVEGEVSP